MSERNAPYPEIAKDRIKSTLLLKALQDHVLEGVEMKDSQIKAAIALLKKTVPDLQAVTNTVQGPDGGPVQISSVDAAI